uniref:Methyltransferase HEMK2 n=1 Tax=Pelusios castaneus TaxID=367368 RepID=A0A8C8SSP5_9SAUR
MSRLATLQIYTAHAHPLAEGRAWRPWAMMIPTPRHQHVRPHGPFSEVYEPAEDTFLLLDALEKDAAQIREARCELRRAGRSSEKPVSSQWEQPVGKQRGLTSHCNRVPVTGLLPRLNGKVDLLLFNPPYVVTPSEEVESHGIEAAWAGGKNGREVMDRLFPLVPDLLSKGGLFYLVTIKENNPDDILETMKKYGLRGIRVLSRQAGRETLTILKFSKF